MTLLPCPKGVTVSEEVCNDYISYSKGSFLGKKEVVHPVTKEEGRQKCITSPFVACLPSYVCVLGNPSRAKHSSSIRRTRSHGVSQFLSGWELNKP